MAVAGSNTVVEGEWAFTTVWPDASFFAGNF